LAEESVDQLDELDAIDGLQKISIKTSFFALAPIFGTAGRFPS
jgi:hypothetical protein